MNELLLHKPALLALILLMGIIGYFLKVLHGDFKRLTESVADIQRTLIRGEGEVSRKLSLLEQAQQTLKEQLSALRYDQRRLGEKLDFLASGGALTLTPAERA